MMADSRVWLAAGCLSAVLGAAVAQELPLYPGETHDTEETQTTVPAAQAPMSEASSAAPAVVDETGEAEWVEQWVEGERAAALSRLTDAVVAPMATADDAPLRDAVEFVVSVCPRELLGKLLAGGSEELDTLTALAIEAEVLTLCGERQSLVTAIFEQEAALRELRAKASGAGSVVVGLDEGAQEPADVEPASVAMLSQFGDGDDGAQGAVSGAAAAADESGDAGAQASEPAPPPPPPAPSYAWFSVIGSKALGLSAGVTDGEGWWFVRVGDALPGGVRVEEIVASPPGVRVSGAAYERLPEGMHPWAGEGKRDDG